MHACIDKVLLTTAVTALSETQSTTKPCVTVTVAQFTLRDVTVTVAQSTLRAYFIDASYHKPSELLLDEGNANANYWEI